MVLEVAVLNIKPGKEREFEASFSVAQEIISSMHGYKWQKCPLALVCNEQLT